MISKLRDLNFSELIAIDTPDLSNYSFDTYRKNGFRHKIKGFCISCEKMSINNAIGFPEFKLTNISHGAHTTDFIDSIKQNKPVIDHWHEEPVVFIFEAPSLDYGIYEDFTFNRFSKRPAVEWYWVHSEREFCQFPEYFKGGQYGELIFSIINTFKLKNAYITNLVKCGMNNPKGNFKGIDYYSKECINNCIENFLKKEIQILTPKVIFTVGTKVDSWVKHFIKEQIPIYNLPHPAGRRRGFKDDFFKILYFWLTAKALFDVKITKEPEIKNLSAIFFINGENIG